MAAVLRQILQRAWARAVLGAAVALAAWALAAATLPSGLPAGIVLYGLVLGSLSSLIALGLVLVHRSARIINFAQADIGGLAAAVAVMMVIGWHLPYFAALVLGLLAAVVTGAVVDAVVVRRFFRAPRLILTVATLGVAQIVGAAEIGLPSAFTHTAPLKTFTTPFTFSFDVGPIVFNGNHVLAMIVVPLVLVGLWWFLGRTDTGIAIRGAADSDERALLLGIPVRRLSRVTWMVAAGLSGIGAMLTAPILGPQLGVNAGPEVLLAPLAAAVVARMESLWVAFVTSLVIGVFEQAVFWSYPQSHSVDVAMFVLVWVALLLQRRRRRRVDDSGLGAHVAVREVRRVPAVLARRPEVRVARWLGAVALAAFAVTIPFGISTSKVTLLTYALIYGIIAVSLVVLTGWAGQVSLGQFAFVGVGSATTGALLVHAHADFLLALVASAAVGAATAVVVGIPALRIPGLMLAVATMAFAVPVSTYVLNSSYFPLLNPQIVRPPVLFGRLPLHGWISLYEFSLAVLALAMLLARTFRRLRGGRAAVSVRDNERGAAVFGIRPAVAKLTAFSLSGALAGVAGGLYVVAQRGVGFNGYNPELSIVAFTMVVVGGLGSVPGALLGALYVESAQYFLKNGAAELLSTGAGLLVLLMIVPGGLGELLYAARDRLLALLARTRGISVPGFTERAGAAGEEAEAPPQPAGRPDAGAAPHGDELAACHGLDAGYGPVQVLFGVDLSVRRGEILALLGTNGAGKSTVLRAMAGLMPATGGTVSLDGRDLHGVGPVERVRMGMVMVPGGRGVFPSLTVEENLRLGGWLRRRDPAGLAVARAEVLALFPALERRLHTHAADLSGGEQQMLTLAQALLCQPRLLLVDELSLGLAPTVVAELLDVVRRLAAQGTTIVVVEQSLNVAAALAPRAVFLERGNVRFTGETAELADRPELARAVFLHGGASPAMRRAFLEREVAQTRRGQPGDQHHEAEPGQPAFEVREVSRRFGGVEALRDVSLAAAPGEVLGIIGANGAGKTTLFDICSGFLPPDTGTVRLRGRDVTTLGAPDRARLGLGRVFQDARLFPSLTVAETLAVTLDRHVAVREPLANVLGLGAALDAQERVLQRVEDLLVTMGLEPYRDTFVSELSTGTRRIVELAGALAHDPSVLLLDEPSSGIAQRESEALAALLLRVRAETGATLIVIEHDIPLVSSLADRLVCLHLGEVIAEGPPTAVLDDPEVVAAYLGTDEVAIARSG
ncbi:MAG: ATP-binding cassette domain-containing protein [Acidimicrobiales bacterium]